MSVSRGVYRCRLTAAFMLRGRERPAPGIRPRDHGRGTRCSARLRLAGTEGPQQGDGTRLEEGLPAG